MTARPHEPMTVEDFLAWAGRQGEENLYELVDGHPVVCENGTARHDALVTLLLAQLVRSRGPRDPCRAYAFRSLRTSRGMRRPDLLITCTPARGRAEVDATFVVEVLSESTTKTDVTAKVREYTALPSVQPYLVLDPEADAPFGYLFTRTDLGHHTQLVEDGTLGSAGVHVDLGAVYAGLPPLGE